GPPPPLALAQALPRLLTVGDVVRRAVEELLAGIVGRAPEESPVGAVLAAIARLEVDARLAGPQPAELAGGVGAVVGMDEVPVGLAEDLGPVVAEGPLPRGIQPPRARVGSGDQEEIGRELEEPVELLLRVSPGRGVHRDRLDPDLPPLLVQQRAPGARPPADAPVLGQDT